MLLFLAHSSENDNWIFSWKLFFYFPFVLSTKGKSLSRVVYLWIMLRVSESSLSKFKQKFRSKFSSVNLESESERCIILCLQFFFIVETTDIESLLDLSREYQIKKIKDMCETHLLRKIPSIDQFIVAQEYDLPLLKEKCMKQLADKALNGLQEHPRFIEINDKNRLLILEQQLKRLQTYCKKVSQITNASDLRCDSFVQFVRVLHEITAWIHVHATGVRFPVGSKCL